MTLPNQKLISSDWEIGRKVQKRFRSRYLGYNGFFKTLMDPAYGAVADLLQEEDRPLIDLGCGAGFLIFYLQEKGYAGPMLGIDLAADKIAEANEAAQRGGEADKIRFLAGDVGEVLPEHGGHVVVLDVLQYLPIEGRRIFLQQAAARVTPGAQLILRSGLKDESPRYRWTRWGDKLSVLTAWIKAKPVDYPTREEIEGVLREQGLTGSAEPLWGKMPFNNYMFRYRREA
jgi:SAM-dependent methyltransferase